MATIDYEITEHIATLDVSARGSLELNRVAWDGRAAKLEVRTWFGEPKKPGKGIVLSDVAAEVLRVALGMTDIELSDADREALHARLAGIEIIERIESAPQGVDKEE